MLCYLRPVKLRRWHLFTTRFKNKKFVDDDFSSPSHTVWFIQRVDVLVIPGTHVAGSGRTCRSPGTSIATTSGKCKPGYRLRRWNLLEFLHGFLMTTRWWRLKYVFMFIPTWGNDPSLTDIFQMGWNHQLVMIFRYECIFYGLTSDNRKMDRHMI